MYFILIDDNSIVTSCYKKSDLMFYSAFKDKTDAELLKIGKLVDTFPNIAPEPFKQIRYRYNNLNNIVTYEYIDRNDDVTVLNNKISQLENNLTQTNQAIAELTMFLSTPTT